MMRSVVVAGVILSLIACSASCVENEPPPASTQKPVTILSPPVSAQPTASQAQPAARAEDRPARAERKAEPRISPSQQAAAASSATPPRGAQFTIFCGRLQGPAHVERAQRIKAELISKTGLNGFYVLHENEQSLLYYGFYRTFNDPKDPKETARAQNDLKRIKSLEYESNRLFGGAVFVDLEAPDPQAPPEWNLVNAQGVWSLQIAAYKDSPQRKEAAVEAVREARKQGIEAYYYHGDTVSSVCIGAWAEHAVRIQDASTSKVNPYDEILVTPPGMGASGLRGRREDVKVINEKVEIIDPSLKQAMLQYPEHAVNGMQMVRSINGKQIPDPSLLIRIPAAPAVTNTNLMTNAPGGYGTGAPAAPQPTQEPAPPARSKRQAPAPTPGLGKLKSIDG